MTPERLYLALFGTFESIFNAISKPFSTVADFIKDHNRNYKPKEKLMLIESNTWFLKMYFTLSVMTFLYVSCNLYYAQRRGYTNANTTCVFLWLAWFAMQAIAALQCIAKFSDAQAYHRFLCANPVIQDLASKRTCIGPDALIGHMHWMLVCYMFSGVCMTLLFKIYHGESRFSKSGFSLGACIFFLWWIYDCHDMFFVLTT